MVQSFLSKTTDEAGVSMYQCIECGKISKVCTNLKDHIEATHIQGLQLECHLCFKSFKSRGRLSFHIRTTHKQWNDSPYESQTVTKLLSRHRSSGSIVRDKNPWCGQLLHLAVCSMWKDIEIFNQHKRSCGSTPSGQYAYWMLYLLQNIQIKRQPSVSHEKSQVITCLYCLYFCSIQYNPKCGVWIWLPLDLEALVQSYLERSMDEVTGSPMWICKQCGKTSAKLGNIRDHIEANHIDGPRRVCQICMRSFKSSASLRMHKIRYHKDWKWPVTHEHTWRELNCMNPHEWFSLSILLVGVTFNCLEAGGVIFKTFVSEIENVVESFMRKAGSELGSVWHCTQCGKTSKKKSNIKEHVEAIHIQGLQIECPTCQRIFKSRASLRIHNLNVHRVHHSFE